MTTGWKVLLEAGVPDGAVRPAPVGLDLPRVLEAVRGLGGGAEVLEPGQVEPLLAWLRGWRHHWPKSFAVSLGADGERLIRMLEARGFDPNRYLKLRRIAVENLAGLLSADASGRSSYLTEDQVEAARDDLKKMH